MLIALFAILVRLLPPSWIVPLYIFFVVLSAIFVGRERRQIVARRRKLETTLRDERVDLDKWSPVEEE